jgi:nucleoside-diphosphate-sugar epimerase
MKLFITGSHGKIGNFLTISAEKNNIISISVPRKDFENNNKLEKFFNLNKVNKVDWLIICHGNVPSRLSNKKNTILDLYESNVNSVLRLTNGFIKNHGINIFYMSSLSVYYSLNRFHFINFKTKEVPSGSYGKSKLDCELKLINNLKKNDSINLLIFRSPRVLIGCSQIVKLIIGNIMHSILLKLLNIIFVRPYISVKDFKISFFEILHNFESKKGITIIVPKRTKSIGFKYSINEKIVKNYVSNGILKSIFIEPFIRKLK